MGGGDLVRITDRSIGDKPRSNLISLSLSLSLFTTEFEEELASVHFSKLGESLEGRAAS